MHLLLFHLIEEDFVNQIGDLFAIVSEAFLTAAIHTSVIIDTRVHVHNIKKA